MAKRRKTRSVARTRRTSPQPKPRSRRRSKGTGSSKVNMQSLLMLAGGAIAGGVLAGKLTLIRNNPAINAGVLLAGTGFAAMKAKGPTSMLMLGVFAGTAGKAIGQIVPRLADESLAESLADDEFTVMAEDDMLDDDMLDDGNEVVYLDDAGQEMMLDETNQLRYLSDGSLADASYQDSLQEFYLPS